MGSPIYRGHRPTADAACVGAGARGRRGHPRQDRHLRIRRHDAERHHQSAQPRAHARRLVERIGRGGRRLHGAGGIRHADRRLGAAARLLLRRVRLQADLRRVQPPRRLSGGREPRHDRADRALDRRHRASQRRCWSCARPSAAGARSIAPPRIGLCRTPMWDKAQPETVAAIEDAAARLGKAGAQVREIVLPDEFAGLRNAARETINNYERAAAMALGMEHASRPHQRAAAQAHRDRPRHAAWRVSRRPAARRELPRAVAARVRRTSTCC